MNQLVSQTDAKNRTTAFAYDKLGRMTRRVAPGLTGGWVYDRAAKGKGKLASNSASNGFQRSLTYDVLGRLSGAEIVDGPPAKSYRYDLVGNMTFKSDVGIYSNPAPGAAQPHAVTSVAAGQMAGGINVTFLCDANGNIVSGNARGVTWTAFNMPASSLLRAATGRRQSR